MKTFFKRSGFSLFDLLFVVIVTGIVAAIAIPSLVTSRQTAKVRSAAAALRSIQSAQIVYRAKLGGNKAFATFDALRAAGLLEEPLAGAGYLITESLSADRTAYCAKASPVLSTGETKYFGINQKGVVYQSNAADEITCAAGILTISGGAAPLY